MADVVAVLGLKVDASGAIQTMRQFGDATEKTARQSSELERGVMRLVGGFAAYKALQWARETVALADAWTNLQNRIGLVTNGHQAMLRTLGDVYALAQQTRTALAPTADVYLRLARNATQLKATQSDLLTVTRAINQSFVISGAGAQSMQAALIQLGQAFASGVLRGEELNSVLEQAPRLAEAIARGMGVTVGQLRAMGAAGTLTSKAVFDALKGQADVIDTEFGQMRMTVSQSFTVLRNEVQKYIGEADQANGASATLASAIQLLATNLRTLTTTATALVGVLGGRWLASFAAAHAQTTAMYAQVARGNAVMLGSVQAQRGAAAAAVQRAQAEVGASNEAIAALQRERAAIMEVQVAERQRLATSTVRVNRAVPEAQLAPLGERVRMRDNAAVVIAMRERAAAQQALIAMSTRAAATDAELTAAQARLAAATTAVTAAQARQTTVMAATTIGARAATVAMGALGSAVALVGGPIGVAILAAMALNAWFDKIIDKRQQAVELTAEEEAAYQRSVATATARAQREKQAAEDAKATAEQVRKAIGEKGVELQKQIALNNAYGQTDLQLRILAIRYDAQAEKVKNAEGHTKEQTSALNALTNAMAAQQIRAARLADQKATQEELTRATDDYIAAQNAERIAAVDSIQTAKRQTEETRRMLLAVREGPAAVQALTEALEAEAVTRQFLTDSSKMDAAEREKRLAQILAEVRARQQLTRELTVATDAAKTAEDARKEAGEQAARATAQRAKQMLNSMQQTLSGFFAGIFEGGIKTFDDLFQRIKSMFLRMVADMLAANVVRRMASVVGGVLGIAVPGTARAHVPSDFGPTQAQRDSLAQFAAAFPTTGQQVAQGAGIGLAGLGTGYGLGGALYSQSHGTAGNYARGALGGAAGGAATGAMIGAMGGPIGVAAGAVIGGVAGLVGGILGIGSAAKKAEREAQELRKALASSLDVMRAQVKGDDLAVAIAQEKARFDAMRKQTDEAYRGRKNEAERNRILAELGVLEAQRIKQLQEEAAALKQQVVDNWQVRLLRAQGKTEEADALQRQLNNDREIKALRDQGFDETFIAWAQWIQAMEAANAATAAFTSELLNVPQGYKVAAGIFKALLPQSGGAAGPFDPTPMPGPIVPSTPIMPAGPVGGWQGHGGVVGKAQDAANGYDDTPVVIQIDGEVVARTVVRRGRRGAAARGYDTTEWWQGLQ